MKKLVPMIVVTVISFSLFSSFGIEASAYHADNNGVLHNYYSTSGNIFAQYPDSYFPAGYSWVTTSWIDIYLDDGVAATAKPYYNRQAFTSDKAKEITAGSMTGVYHDGYVNCNGITSWSSTHQSVGSETGTVSCDGYQTITFRGNIYWD